MPQCLKCGAELPVNEDGMAPVLCDRCAGVATRRARVSMGTGTFREFPATTALLAINLAVFVGMVLTGGSIFDFNGQTLIRWGGNFGPLTLTGDYWRLVAAGFVHGGLLHIAFNMWCLYSLGQLAERLFGSWITFAVYMLTGVGGALLSVGWNPMRLEVGASGAIFGIAGAILSGIKFGNVSVSSWQKRQIFSSLIFFVGVNLFIGLGPGIDNMCHLGGLISGLIFGVPLATAAASGKKSFEWLTIVVAALVLAGVGAQVVKARAPVANAALHQNSLRVAQHYINSGNYADAIVLLQQLSAFDPHDAETQATLGAAYEANGQVDKAIAAYQRAVQLDPNLSRVKSHLDQLRSQPPAEK
jgi:rhomboid protease GluP